MSKRKEIIMKDGAIPLHLQWVGPTVPGKYSSYIRFEREGHYCGSLSDRQAKRLMNWLMIYFGEKPQQGEK